ncbi:hypothetical protein AJ78_09039, partial [Emergomyces pasteurianus Ep9510]
YNVPAIRQNAILLALNVAARSITIGLGRTTAAPMVQVLVRWAQTAAPKTAARRRANVALTGAARLESRVPELSRQPAPLAAVPHHRRHQQRPSQRPRQRSLAALLPRGLDKLRREHYRQ